MKFQSFNQLKHRNSFAALGSKFSVSSPAIPIREPQLLCHNVQLASVLGIEVSDKKEITQIFSGNRLPDSWQPVAHRYAGHQYGKFNHFLGDGRCIHLTELITDRGLVEISLKGSGKTPFSRDADGRANLATGIKEFLFSVALDALGTPTSQVLYLIRGKNPVSRSGSLQPSSVLTRVAPNFIRFGHFENFHYSGDSESIKTLANYCLENHFQACLNSNDPYQAMLDEVVITTAKLIAHWQSIGFVHGTMNTDNQSICGLTLDHGTCAFLDVYNPDYVSTSDDPKALFAFDQQPSVGAWNCNIFAQTLSSLLSKDKIAQSLNLYGSSFEQHYLTLMREKLGLRGQHKDDIPLIQDLLTIFNKNRLSYTQSLRGLSNISCKSELSSALPEKHKHLYEAIKEHNWIDRYSQRADPDLERRQSRMNEVNPEFVLQKDDLDNVIRAALDGDNSQLETLLKSVTNPFRLAN